MNNEQKMKKVDHIVRLCERATTSKYCSPRGEAIEMLVELAIGIFVFVLFCLALVIVNKNANFYGVSDGVTVLLILLLAILFAAAYIHFQFRMIGRTAEKTTLIIQRIFPAQTPTWQKTISTEFRAYSPADQTAFDALMAQKDETGCVTLEQVRSWHAKEIQDLKSLQEISSEQEVRKICISQPE